MFEKGAEQVLFALKVVIHRSLGAIGCRCNFRELRPFITSRAKNGFSCSEQLGMGLLGSKLTLVQGFR
jgi:hypothetical protein